MAIYAVKNKKYVNSVDASSFYQGNQKNDYHPLYLGTWWLHLTKTKRTGLEDANLVPERGNDVSSSPSIPSVQMKHLSLTQDGNICVVAICMGVPYLFLFSINGAFCMDLDASRQFSAQTAVSSILLFLL